MSDRRMAQILCEMGMLSEVRAARAGDVVHGGERNQVPPGPNESLADEFRRRWIRAHSKRAQAETLEAAEQALRNAKRGPQGVGLIEGTLEWRMAIAKAEGSAADVAADFRISKRTVYRMRAQGR